MADRWVVGVDIGGTNVVVGLVPFAGGPALGVRSRPTEGERGADAVVEDIGAMTEAVVRDALGGDSGRVVGVGIGCPGPLDLAAGRTWGRIEALAWLAAGWLLTGAWQAARLGSTIRRSRRRMSDPMYLAKLVEHEISEATRS